LSIRVPFPSKSPEQIFPKRIILYLAHVFPSRLYYSRFAIRTFPFFRADNCCFFSSTFDSAAVSPWTLRFVLSRTGTETTALHLNNAHATRSFCCCRRRKLRGRQKQRRLRNRGRPGRARRRETASVIKSRTSRRRRVVTKTDGFPEEEKERKFQRLGLNRFRLVIFMRRVKNAKRDSACPRSAIAWNFSIRILVVISIVVCRQIRMRRVLFIRGERRFRMPVGACK